MASRNHLFTKGATDGPDLHAPADSWWMCDRETFRQRVTERLPQMRASCFGVNGDLAFGPHVRKWKKRTPETL